MGFQLKILGRAFGKNRGSRKERRLSQLEKRKQKREAKRRKSGNTTGTVGSPSSSPPKEIEEQVERAWIGLEGALQEEEDQIQNSFGSKLEEAQKKEEEEASRGPQENQREPKLSFEEELKLAMGNRAAKSLGEDAQQDESSVQAAANLVEKKDLVFQNVPAQEEVQHEVGREQIEDPTEDEVQEVSAQAQEAERKITEEKKETSTDGGEDVEGKNFLGQEPEEAPPHVFDDDASAASSEWSDIPPPPTEESDGEEDAVMEESEQTEADENTKSVKGEAAVSEGREGGTFVDAGKAEKIGQSEEIEKPDVVEKEPEQEISFAARMAQWRKFSGDEEAQKKKEAEEDAEAILEEEQRKIEEEEDAEEAGAKLDRGDSWSVASVEEKEEISTSLLAGSMLQDEPVFYSGDSIMDGSTQGDTSLDTSQGTSYENKSLGTQSYKNLLEMRLAITEQEHTERQAPKTIKKEPQKPLTITIVDIARGYEEKGKELEWKLEARAKAQELEQELGLTPRNTPVSILTLPEEERVFFYEEEAGWLFQEQEMVRANGENEESWDFGNAVLGMISLTAKGAMVGARVANYGAKGAVTGAQLTMWVGENVIYPPSKFTALALIRGYKYWQARKAAVAEGSNVDYDDSIAGEENAAITKEIDSRFKDTVTMFVGQLDKTSNSIKVILNGTVE